ncbi:MAG: ArsA family ATPase, partial [Deltaproteobacteria bacterium]|nr:ArsA family ATPase [Deltaproteobacteria bacterium]
MRGASEEPGFLTDVNVQLLLFGGKGGVGKTTASAATALHLASLYPEKSLLLVSTDPAHSLADSFDGTVPPANLQVMELDVQAYLADFKEKNRQRLMEMPDLIRKWLEALDALLAKHRYMKKLFRGTYERDDLDHFIEGLAASVKQMEKLLKDHRQCQFVPVMLAEALSIEETLDLIRELQRLRIGVVDVVINRLYPE